MSDQSSKDLLVSYEMDEEESASLSIINAISAVSNKSISDLDPLIRTIDTDALDTITEDNSVGVLTFRHNGFKVTIRGNVVHVTD